MSIYEQLRDRQPRVIHLLENSMKKNRLSHAYLFYGNKGTQKTACAKLLAKSFLCHDKIGALEPCEECVNCLRIEHGNHPDVHMVQPEGTSIKTEQVRFLQKEYAYSGMESVRKVFIIEHCDTMTVQAANRMLKTIEEPLSGILTILTTEKKEAVLPTIRSRVQLIPFQEPGAAELEKELEQAGVPKAQIKVILQLTTDLEEAVLMGQEGSFADSRQLVLKLYEALEARDTAAFLMVQTEWMPHFGNKDRERNVLGLSLFSFVFRDILYRKLGQAGRCVMEETADFQMDRYSERSLFDILDKIQSAQRKIQQNFNIQMVLENLVLYVQEV